MKKNVLLIFTMSLASIFYSCDDEELTIANVNAVDASLFVVDETSAEATVFSIYSSLQFSDAVGGGMASTLSNMGPASTGPFFNKNHSSWTANSLDFNNQGFFANSFADLYRIVGRANFSIEEIAKLSSDQISDQRKNNLLGEAYFLRGLAYFWLATTYNNGSIPVTTKVAQVLADTQVNPNRPREEVYARIFDDFKLAVGLLPDEWANFPQGSRAVSLTATAFLGKAYLYEKMYDEAAVEFKKVIDSNKYSLVPDFMMNTNIAGEHNVESIFEVGFSQTPEVTSGNFGGGEGNNINETTTRTYLFGSAEGRGWNLVHNTNFIAELFKNDVPDPANTINEFTDLDVDGDPVVDGAGDEVVLPGRYTRRAVSTIAVNGDGQQFYEKYLTPSAVLGDGAAKNNLQFTVSRSTVRKFQNWTLEDEPVAAVSEINERIMRYADVLLMYAESLMRGSNATASVSEAISLINMVRARAGAVSLETLFATDRDYLLSNFANNPFPVQSGSEMIPAVAPGAFTPEIIIKHLMDEERILEFAYEGRGITWHDLRRRDDTAEFLRKLVGIVYQRQGFTSVDEFEDAASKFEADPVNAGFIPIPIAEDLAKR